MKFTDYPINSEAFFEFIGTRQMTRWNLEVHSLTFFSLDFYFKVCELRYWMSKFIQSGGTLESVCYVLTSDSIILSDLDFESCGLRFWMSKFDQSGGIKA